MEFEKLNGLKRTHKCANITKEDIGKKIIIISDKIVNQCD